jgi:hypothetical protein
VWSCPSHELDDPVLILTMSTERISAVVMNISVRTPWMVFISYYKVMLIYIQTSEKVSIPQKEE